MEITQNKVVEMFRLEHQLIAKRDELWEKINANGDCDLRPSEIMRKRPAFRFLNTYLSRGKHLKHQINISGGNIMLLDQIGRALAMLQSWELIAQFDAFTPLEDYPELTSTREGQRMMFGTVIRHKVTGRIVAVGMVKKEFGATQVMIAEVYNLNAVTKKWTFHMITEQVRKGTSYMKGAFYYNLRLHEFSPAYTKYHFLAEFLSGGKINILADECSDRELLETTHYQQIVYSFRHELWARICGYDNSAILKFEKLYAAAKKEAEELSEDLVME